MVYDQLCASNPLASHGSGGIATCRSDFLPRLPFIPCLPLLFHMLQYLSQKELSRNNHGQAINDEVKPVDDQHNEDNGTDDSEYGRIEADGDLRSRNAVYTEWVGPGPHVEIEASFGNVAYESNDRDDQPETGMSECDTRRLALRNPR